MATKLIKGLDGKIENPGFIHPEKIDLIPIPCPQNGQSLVFSYLMSSNRKKK